MFVITIKDILTIVTNDDIYKRTGHVVIRSQQPALVIDADKLASIHKQA